MLFTELRFVFFFVSTLAACWLLRANRARMVWLLVASWVFYAGWEPRFLLLLWASTAANFVAGLGIERAGSATGRRAWLVGGIVFDLGVLAAFKYAGFFLDAATDLLSLLGAGVAVPAVAIALPIGISFFTFQGISYLVDVWRGTIPASRRPIDFALFIALFPHLVAGPIVRASELLPQFRATPRFADVRVRVALLLLLSGFVKKACIADRIAAVVDPVFASPAAYDVVSKWLAATLYHVQIYCDFSGYTDMAIAIAALLGYTLPENFAFPYLRGSVRDFWRGWHITLTRWFRDYVYVPLGGNRGSALATARNLFAVFLLCGLWHGAAWTFVAWGGVHGMLLVAERGPFGRAVARLPRVIAVLYVNLVVLLAWVLFRSPDFDRAAVFLGGLFGGGVPPAAAIAAHVDLAWALLLPPLIGAHLVAKSGAVPRLAARLPDWAFALAYGALAAAVLPFVATGILPFIYFQF